MAIQIKIANEGSSPIVISYSTGEAPRPIFPGGDFTDWVSGSRTISIISAEPDEILEDMESGD